MAPRKPLAKRASRPSRLTTTTPTSIPDPPTGHRPTKQTERRAARHAALLTKIQTSALTRPKTGGISKPSRTNPLTSNSRALKGRRPAKKLAGAGTMSAEMLDALPNFQAAGQMRDEGKVSVSSSATKREGAALVALAGRSLGNRKGLQRKREMVGRMERERWGKNWGAMVGSQGVGSADSVDATAAGRSIASKGAETEIPAHEAAQAERWAALRRHISGSLASI